MLTQTSHNVLCDILRDFYRYLAVEDNHTMSEIYKLSKTEGEEQYLDMSSVFLEFQEYSPISAGDIFFVIRKKFPYFDDWQTKVLHEASKRFMNEFDRSCGTTADEFIIRKTKCIKIQNEMYIFSEFHRHCKYIQKTQKHGILAVFFIPIR